MNAKLAQRILKMAKWNIDLNVPEDVRKKCVMIVAPHTSLWDWVLGKMVFAAMEIKPVVMIKKEFFSFPIGGLLRKLGGIPVDRKNPKRLPMEMAERFANSDHLCVVITPEGTRKRTEKWKKGFYFIARQAQVPIAIGYTDWGHKRCGIFPNTFMPTGNYDADLAFIQQHYFGMIGKYKGQFNLEDKK